MSEHHEIVFDVSICPTNMEVDGDTLDERAVTNRIREVAAAKWPGCRFETLQVGHRQGDEWFRCWIDGKRDEKTDAMARNLVWEMIDWTDEALYSSDRTGAQAMTDEQREIARLKELNAELLAACRGVSQQLVDLHAAIGDQQCTHLFIDESTNMLSEGETSLHAARTAIAKAEGDAE